MEGTHRTISVFSIGADPFHDFTIVITMAVLYHSQRFVPHTSPSVLGLPSVLGKVTRTRRAHDGGDSAPANQRRNLSDLPPST